MPTRRQLRIAITLEAPAHALELGQRLQHRLVGYTQFHRDADGGQRVEHVVLARQVQHHIQIGQFHAVASLHREVHLGAHRAHIQRPHLGILGQSVAGDGARDLRQDVADGGVVHTHHRCAVERHAVQELDEGGLEATEVVTVGVHVVGVDVGHHRQHRQQVQERGIGLVRLDHDVFARTQLRVGTRAVEPPADHEGGVQLAAASTLATRLVVVVLPWVPAMATPFFMRISSASITARGTTGIRRAWAATTSGLSSLTAVEVTMASAPSMYCSSCPVHRGAQRHQAARGRVLAQVAARNDESPG
jgi:hypothetical protein